MDTSSVLWTNWHEQLKELLTGMHGHQKKTLAFFVLGIVLAGSAVMQRVAETVSERGLSEAKMTSIERRFARFIGNSRAVITHAHRNGSIAIFLRRDMHFAVIDRRVAHCLARIAHQVD